MDAIVVGVDASEAAAHALRWAADEAGSAGARLVVVHAYRPPLAYVGDEDVVAHLDPALHEEVLGHLHEFLRRSGVDLSPLHVEERLHPGRPSDGLLAASAAADLLVVGARGGGGFDGLHLGSTAGHCARHASVPVVVVRPPAPSSPARILVGVDGSSAAIHALRWATDLARRRGATIEVVGVYRPHDPEVPFGGEFPWHRASDTHRRLRDRAQGHVDEAVMTVLEESDVAWHTTVAQGHPAHLLVEESRMAQLLVVGATSGPARPGHLGAVTRQVLHHAGCPVAVVRS
ncbi:MAG TPA: universal stress protein [Egicoccus sp.]|nr:universal stress protein [Egicoccus sp.]HSK23171.1 universal stress protein [Egicoccus sp.]